MKKQTPFSSKLLYTFLILLLWQFANAQYFYNDFPEADGYTPIATSQQGQGYQIVTEKFSGNIHYFKVLHLDASGELLSSEDISFEESNQQAFLLNDGNFITFSKVANELFYSKKDISGNTIWEQSISVPDAFVSGQNTAENANGEFFFTGYLVEASGEADDMLTMKFTPDGTLLWNTIYTPANFSSISDVRINAALSDGGVILTGLSDDSPYYYLRNHSFKLDNNGSFLWTNYSSTFGTSGNLCVGGQTNNVFVQRASNSYTYNIDTNLPDNLWDDKGRYNASDDNTSYSFYSQQFNTAIEPIANGGVLVGGYHVQYDSREMHLVKFDAAGNAEWVMNDYPFYGHIITVDELANGDILLAGLRGERLWVMSVNDAGLPTSTPCETDLPMLDYQGEYLGHYYYLSQNNLPYTQALSYTAGIDGYLASIKSYEENIFVYRIAADNDVYTYIGLNDMAEEGVPAWDNGEAFSYDYTLNCMNCPLNTEEHDVVVIPDYDLVWNWETGDAYRKFIVERDCEQNFADVANELPEFSGITGCFSTENKVVSRYALLSSTSNLNGEKVAASKANDGITAGSMAEHTAAVSLAEEEPAWTSFFYDIFDVEEIHIYGGTDGAPLGNFYVFMTRNYLDPEGSVAELLDNEYIQSYYVSGETEYPIVIPVSGLFGGVRIQKADFGVLNLAEVEVYGCPRGLEELEQFECQEDIVFVADASGTAVIDYDDSRDFPCYGAGNGGSGRFGPDPGEALIPGEYLIEYYTSNDVCGNRYCRFSITVLPFNSGSTLSVDCPPDINVVTNPGETTAVVNWNLPLANSTCATANISIVQSEGLAPGTTFPLGNTMISYEINDNCGNVQVCNFNVFVETPNTNECPDVIDGFILLGEFDDHKYYRSERRFSSWYGAQAAAIDVGGYLLSINSAAENEFILNNMNNDVVFTGLNDNNEEGVLEWDSGEPVTYQNISDCSFCGLNTPDQDWGIFNTWDGTWSFSISGAYRFMVLELECGAAPPQISVTCPPDIALEANAQNMAFPEWAVPDGYTNCQDTWFMITQTSGAESGSPLSPGSYIVAYEATDGCGGLATCSFTVTINPHDPGVDCPEDITGFTQIGAFNNSSYYMSDETMSWQDAESQSSLHGGHLLTINTQEENDFILENITESAFIGFNDATTEGSLDWANGDAVNFTNYSNCSFCGSNDAENDYGYILFWDGSWAFSSIWVQRKFIMEIACQQSIAPLQDHNNVEAISDDITLRNEAAKNVLVSEMDLYPNPAFDKITIVVDAQAKGNTELKIYSILGNLEWQEELNLQKGSNTLNIDIAGLPVGLHHLVLMKKQGIYKKVSFVKQRD